MDLVSKLSAYEIYLKQGNKNTAKAYLRDAKRFCEFINKSVSELETSDVYLFLQHLKEERKYSDRSLARVAFSLRNFLMFVDRDDIARKIKPPSFVVDYVAKFLSEEEVRELIESAPTRFGQLVLRTAYWLALRMNEVPLLRRTELHNCTIVVHRLKRKGGYSHELPLEEKLCVLLNEYLNEREDSFDALFVVPFRKGWRTLSQWDVYRIFDAARKNAGYNVTFHVLRHSRGTHLALKGADVLTIAKWMGHKDPSNSLIYVHLAAQELRRRAEG